MKIMRLDVAFTHADYTRFRSRYKAQGGGRVARAGQSNAVLAMMVA